MCLGGAHFLHGNVAERERGGVAAVSAPARDARVQRDGARRPRDGPRELLDDGGASVACGGHAQSAPRTGQRVHGAREQATMHLYGHRGARPMK